MTRQRGRRSRQVKRRLRAELLQLLCALVGLALGLAVPRVTVGPTVQSSRVSELLFTVGFGVIGVVSVVFSLLFGVVQWSASSFSPRLNLFRGDPLVWRTFAFAVGVFVYCVTAGAATGTAGSVPVLVPVTAVLAVLAAFALIRSLQTRAFLTMQLAHVLDALASRGAGVIAATYPDIVNDERPRPVSPAPDRERDGRVVYWGGRTGVVQQLDLRRLVDRAASADAVVVLRVGVGDALHRDTAVAEISGGDVPDQDVRSAIVWATERTLEQDPALALRLLADIELRALSPGINDPATATDGIAATESLLCSLAGRDLEASGVADDRGVCRVELRLPTWEEFLRIAVGDLLPWAAPFHMVLERLRSMLIHLRAVAPRSRQLALTRLSATVEALLEAVESGPPADLRRNGL